MILDHSVNDFNFMSGGGEMGELIRSKDWSETSLGSPATWPQSLRTTLSILLHSGFPMVLFWGPDLICFYNDAFRPSLGKEGKHPMILGMKAEYAWKEIWTMINPWLDDVIINGNAIWNEDLLVPIYRNGKVEDVYWTFSYSPVTDESGNRAGIFVAVVETTGKINTIKKLEQSEQQFRTMAEASDILIAMCDETSNATYFNRAWMNLTGRPMKDLVDFGWTDFVHPDDKDKFLDIYLTAFASRVPFSGEFRVLNKNGEYRWLLAQGAPLFSHDHVFTGYISSCIDITDQKTAHQKIEGSEQDLRSLVLQAPIGICVMDAPTRICEIVNESFLQIAGKHYEQLAGKFYWDAFAEARPYYEASLTSVVETGITIFANEVKLMLIRHGKEENIYVTFVYVPLKDKNGKVKKVAVWVLENTQQVKARRKVEELVAERTKELKELNDSLKKSEERYHLMVEEVQDYAILYLNPQGFVENWNLGAEKIKGYKANEIIGKSFSNFYTEEDRKNGLPEILLEKARKTGRAVQQGWRVRKDGSLFWASVVITAIHSEGNNVIGFSKVTHDLTEKKEADDLLKLNAAELAQKNLELEKMNKELQSFAYISSHDLQEPLRKIQTFSSQILEKELANLSENGKNRFYRMQVAAQRMQVLIEDLLSYSRTGTAEKKLESVNLQKIVEDVKEDLKEELLQKNATIETIGLCDLNIIPFQFRQLVYNLLSNSLKFSDDKTKPHIIIKAEKANGTLIKNNKHGNDKEFCHISFTDNGIGFEQEYSEKIFEVFQRLHGRNTYPGTGIGLAIVKKIIENHNGMITAKSELNKGTTFDIYIPF